MALGLPVALDDGVPVCEPVALRLAVALDDGLAVCEPVALGLPVALDDGVPVCEPVPLRLAVALGDGVPVCEPVALRLPVALDDGVPVCEPVALGDQLGETLPVALSDGLRRLAMLSPRYIRLATATSASDASHSSDDSSTPDAMVLEGTSCVTLASRKHGEGTASQRRAVSYSVYE